MKQAEQVQFTGKENLKGAEKVASDLIILNSFSL